MAQKSLGIAALNDADLFVAHCAIAWKNFIPSLTSATFIRKQSIMKAWEFLKEPNNSLKQAIFM